MGQIKVTKAPIEGLYIIEPTVHGDSRGYFMETYNQQDMTDAGLPMVFVQDNQSMSTKGVLRGLHTQKKYPQGKLVRVIRGTVEDELGFAWNDPDIGVRWPEVTGTYSGTASAEGYALPDGTPLKLSDKDQHLLPLKQTKR